MVIRLILLFLFCNTLYAQSVYFETITTSNGLSNNSVHSLLSHSSGDLWIGTWDGLNIYDGTKIQVFKHVVNDSTSLPGNSILRLVQDRYDNTWILSDSQYISKYLGHGMFENIPLPFKARDLNLDWQNNVVITLEDDKKYWFEDQFSNRLQIYSNSQEDLRENQQLTKKIRELWNLQTPEQPLNAILALPSEHYLVGTKSKGLFYIENKGDSLIIKNHYTAANPVGFNLSSNEIIDLTKDIFGQIWIGFKDGGVARLLSPDHGISLVDTTQDILPNESVRAILRDSYGHLYLGYYNQGLFVKKSQDSFFSKIDIPRAKDNPNWLRVRSLFSDPNKRLWVGTYAGVMCIDKGEITYFTSENQPLLQENRTYSFALDQNILWIGSWGGLSRFNLDKNLFEPVLKAKEISKVHIRKILVKEDLLFLASESNGVIIYNPKTGDIKELGQDQGLLGNSVYDIYYDPVYKQYWIATLGGISILDEQFNLVVNLTEQDGLPSHLVYSLMQDKGKIWISTTKGIASVDMTSKTILNYNNLTPWQGFEFSEGAYFKDDSNLLIYGGTKGVNIIDPFYLGKPTSNSHFKLWLDNQVVQDNQEFEKPFSKNSFTMALYPIGADNFARGQFEYHIVGLFDKWRVLDNQIQYLDNLNAGQYTIEVRDTGVSGKPIVYRKRFSILEPFYQKSSFIVLFAAFLVGVFYLWVKQRAYNQQKKQRILQQKVSERTAQIATQKQNLLNQNKELSALNQKITKQQNDLLILHSNLKNQDIEMDNFKAFLLSRIKTPIIQLLDSIEKDTSKKTLKDQTSLIYNMIKDWDHLEQIKQLDNHSLMVVNLQEFLQELIFPLIGQLDKQNKLLVFDNQLEHRYTQVDILRLKMLIKYLITECFKYTSSEESLRITAAYHNNDLVLNFKSDCEFLKQHWISNCEYSPYFRAIKTLGKDLQGDLILKETTGFELQVVLRGMQQINNPASESVKWNVLLEDIKILPENKINILVFCSSNDKGVVQQIMQKYNQCNLIFAQGVSQALNYLQHYVFQGVLIYDLELNFNLQSFLTQGKKYFQRQGISVFYLAQQVDYLLEEQLHTLGVNQILHLPLSDSLFASKVITALELVKKNSLLARKNPAYSDPIEQAPVSYDQKLLRKALKVMEKSYHKTDFSIEKLAQELEISKIKCYRLFKDNLNQAPVDVLIEIRMKRAEFLLDNSVDLSISQISFECGYNDPKYFSKTFKKFFGKTPSAYTKEQVV